MRLARWFSILVPVACTACGAAPGTAAATAPVVVPVSAGTAPDPGAPPEEPPTNRTPEEPPEPKPGPAGLAFETPIEACGARQSYRIAASYRCNDGSVPLRGDPSAGQDARQGSSGSHIKRAKDAPMDVGNSHIVDIYEIPCPGGTVTLYVCLYHCAAGESPFGAP